LVTVYLTLFVGQEEGH